MPKWTTETLYTHFKATNDEAWKRIDDRFTASQEATTTALAAAEKAVNAALVASEKAVLKAESLAETRAAQQNEWRGTVTDLTHTMMPRAEYEAAHDAIAARLTNLEARANSTEGTAKGANATVVWLFIGLAGFISVVGLFINVFTH